MATKASSEVKVRSFCTGFDLREMFAVASRWLEKNAAAIDALNVFPVPDGDTGTNMLFTMKAAVEEASRVKEDNVSLVARALAHGALIGARGNSGVILSQMFKGLALGLDGRPVAYPLEISQALEEAARAAYRGLSKPVEGTMLTVMKDVAAAVREVATNSKDLTSLAVIAVREARDSVARTPELLSVLKEGGVVDAGGQGLYIILEGVLHYLKGEADSIILMSPGIAPASLPPSLKAAEGRQKLYGYCTEFIIKGEKLNPDRVRRKIEARGESVLVVGDDAAVKVHIHTTDPGSVLKIGTAAGSLHDLKIQNMDDQHEDFVQMRRGLARPVRIATVEVVSGTGLEAVIRSLGATAIVPGGQTMNPSTQELLGAIEFVPSDKVIVMPNNKNVILTAQQAASLSKKEVKILPTTSIPQGIAALVAFNQEAELDRNIAEMDKAFRQIRSIEISSAVRGARIGRIRIGKGQFIGFVDGDLKAAGEDRSEVIEKTLAAAGVEKAELLTVYFGAGITAEGAEVTAASLRERHPNLETEVVSGGQPHYSYIMSLE
ncbi:MAG: DAK2 domain-containing protein [Chloroflexi bacterium]|nr:DAK2 domain-containing protein [Chloroflexota bacterium]